METSINLLQITNIINTTKATRQTVYIEVRETIAEEAMCVETIGEAFKGDQAPEAEVVIYVRRNAISIASQIASRQSTYLRNGNTPIRGLKHAPNTQIYYIQYIRTLLYKSKELKVL